MILTIDVGNTAISFKFDSSKTTYNIILEQINCNTTEDCVGFLQQFLAIKNIDQKYVKSIIICSVVDSKKILLLEALKIVFEAKPQCLVFDKQDIIKIKTDNPGELGADMIATAIGATKYFNNDICVIDCGTATTISILNREKEFLSTSIMPGIRLQFEALADNTFKLPKLNPESSKDLLGKNTNDSILSGVLRGHAFSISGFIKEINISFPDLTVILTGGFSGYIRDYLDFKYKFYPDLIHDGLKEIIKK